MNLTARLQVIRQHQREVVGLAFHPHGTMLATGSADMAVNLYFVRNEGPQVMSSWSDERRDDEADGRRRTMSTLLETGRKKSLLRQSMARARRLRLLAVILFILTRAAGLRLLLPQTRKRPHGGRTHASVRSCG